MRKEQRIRTNFHSMGHRMGQGKQDKSIHSSKDRIRNTRNNLASNRDRSPIRPSPSHPIRSRHDSRSRSHRDSHSPRDSRRTRRSRGLLTRNLARRLRKHRRRLQLFRRLLPHDLRHRDLGRRAPHYLTSNMQTSKMRIKEWSFSYVTHALRLSLMQDSFEWLKCTIGGAFRPAMDAGCPFRFIWLAGRLDWRNGCM